MIISEISVFYGDFFFESRWEWTLKSLSWNQFIQLLRSLQTLLHHHHQSLQPLPRHSELFSTYTLSCIWTHKNKNIYINLVSIRDYYVLCLRFCIIYILFYHQCRIFRNSAYDPSFEMRGLPLDPHLRLFFFNNHPDQPVVW